MSARKEAMRARYAALRAQPIATRPHLIDHLIKLGKNAETVNTLTVGRAYNWIHTIIGRNLGKASGKRTDAYYHLWAAGMPFDFLRTIERADAQKMADAIKANKGGKAA